MTKATVTEAASVATLPAGGAQVGNMLIQLITPGVGSSGVYSAEVLEAAARDVVFPAGTLMFADHPGEMEAYDRPERSIRDVAGVLVENARWDPTAQALVANARTYTPWTQVLTEMKDAIGVSIRAGAVVGETDAASGRPIVSRLTTGISVDFVTQAGRGGAIREVYESARGRAALLVQETHPLDEASANTRRDELRGLVKAAHPGVEYTYVEDYDDEARTVVYSHEQPDGPTVYHQQAYTVTDGVATGLVGTPTPVQRQVVYVSTATNTTGPPSVTATPAGQSITHESKEDTMPNIEEGRLAQLEEADRRVPVLVSERDAAVERATAAEAALAEANTATDAALAAQIIAEADHEFTALERRGLLAQLPTTEDGRLDAEAFKATVTAEAATAAEAAGAGSVRGFGAATTDTKSESDLSEADLDAQLAAISGRTVKEA